METVNQIEYNGALYNVKDAEAQKSLVYSQNEIDTGKIWINGKKIYRKVINCGALPNNSTKTIPINITDIDEITNLIAIASSKTYSLTISLPFCDINGTAMAVHRRKNEIVLATNLDASIYTESFVVLEYIKTTN